MQHDICRARSALSHKWISGYVLDTGRQHYIVTAGAAPDPVTKIALDGEIVNIVRILPETLSRYTGHMDRYGEPIYEHAIVRKRGYNRFENMSVVRLDDGSFRAKGERRFYPLNDPRIVVLGNIFEDSHLLKHKERSHD